MQLKGEKASWTLVPGCGSDLAEPSCVVAMQSLQMLKGTKVEARIRARNCCGWSEYAEALETAVINEVPSKPEKPEIVSLSASGFTLRWNESTYKQVIACDGVPRFSDRDSLEIFVPAVAGVFTRVCEVRRENECGSSKSDKLVV